LPELWVLRAENVCPVPQRHDVRAAGGLLYSRDLKTGGEEVTEGEKPAGSRGSTLTSSTPAASASQRPAASSAYAVACPSQEELSIGADRDPRSERILP
jgi:hypothetical protein